MKYFLHDTNAFNDEKITELFINFGYEGVGLFFTILEKLALQEKPIKTIVLKKQLNIGKKLNRCWNFMEDLDIITSINGKTFNKNLLMFCEKYKNNKNKIFNNKYSETLKDPRWQRKRLEIMQRDNFKCTMCGASNKPLNIHHKIYIKGKKIWDYPNELLITLCEDCHHKVHFDKDILK